MRRIEPDIDAGGQQIAPVHIVILDINYRDGLLQRGGGLVDFANQDFAFFVAGMSFSAVNHLEWAVALANGAQSIEIAEEQIGALVGGGASGESDCKRRLAEFRAGAALDFGDHQALGGKMRLLNFTQADADSLTKIEIVASPFRDA